MLSATARSETPPDFQCDRIVRNELPQIKSATTIESINQLRARYLYEQEHSDYPEAYDCLLGMISPRNSAQAFHFLRRACKQNNDFAFARMAYYQSLKWRSPTNSRRNLDNAYYLSPRDPEIVREWAGLQLEENQIEEAHAVFAPYLTGKANEKEAAVGAYLEGRYAWKRQDWLRAEKALADALQASPNDSDARFWSVRLAAVRGRYADAQQAITQAPDTYSQALSFVALATGLNDLARRELSPRKDPISMPAAVWRDQFAKAYDSLGEQLPYGIAWDACRLAQWNDVARSNFLQAWQRFEERIPVTLTIMGASENASRFLALQQAIQASGQGFPETELPPIIEAMTKAGWSAEALETARQLLLLPSANPATNPSPGTSANPTATISSCTAHQQYLEQIAAKMAEIPEHAPGTTPVPQSLANDPAISPVRHPASGAESTDAIIKFLRDHNQYLSWMAEPWEERSCRLMTVLNEDTGYRVGPGQNLVPVNVVIGEDLIPAAGGAADLLAARDREHKDHCYVSVNCEPMLQDLFVQQADRMARIRIQAHFRSGQPWDHWFFTNDDAFSPDTLAVIAQELFRKQGLTPAADDEAPLPPRGECRAFRERVIDGLADYLAKREAFRLALDRKAFKVRGDKDLQSRYYALATCKWPHLAFYHEYREALAGDDKAGDLMKKIMKQAKNGTEQQPTAIREDQPPLLQAFRLTDERIKAIAKELFQG